MGRMVHTAVAPIERVELLLQTQDGNGALLGTSHRFRGFTDCITYTVRDEGVLSLWRGNGTAVNFSLNCILQQAPHHRPRHRVRPGRPQTWMGRPDRLQRAALLHGVTGDAESEQVPAMANGWGVGDDAVARGARGVPLLLLPPCATPPFTLISIPLPAPRLHHHRAHYLFGFSSCIIHDDDMVFEAQNWDTVIVNLINLETNIRNRPAGSVTSPSSTPRL